MSSENGEHGCCSKLVGSIENDGGNSDHVGSGSENMTKEWSSWKVLTPEGA